MKTLIALLLINFYAFAQATIKEIRVKDDGHLEAIVIQVEQFEIILNSMGIINGIELLGQDSIVSRFIISKGHISRFERDNGALDFNDGRISAIGTIPFNYNTIQKEKVEEIGRLEFLYSTVDGRKDNVRKVGCVNLEYKLGTDMVSSIGESKIEYALMSNRILYVIPARDNCSPPVRIICDIGNFK